MSKKRSRVFADLGERWAGLYRNLSLRYIIWISFTLTAAAAAVLIGLSFYGRLSSQLKDSIQEENQLLIEQVNDATTTYLRNMMKISDSLYYSVIKKNDLATDSISDEFQLLYDTNKDYISNIALFTESGTLLETAPAAALKPNVNATQQEWMKNALDKTENLHFSSPAVQNLFISSDGQYNWVISLSRAVQITNGKETSRGVLLIDLRYTALTELFSNVFLGNNGYLYLMDSAGDILYHPWMQLLSSGHAFENNTAAANYPDGNYDESFMGEKRTVTTKSVGYTGWKIVGVTPSAGVTLSTLKSNLFILFLLLFFLTVLVVINSYISSRVSNPILELEKSVKQLEEGNLDTSIEIQGFYEVRHLGTAIKNMAVRIRQLMADIVEEHESKRKSELDTLQSQINPHFLYNTLDIIVWMIENERKSEAVKAVTALARFFRISLSKGKSIITVEDELEHVRNYLTIQKMRYKNRFEYTIDAQEGTTHLISIKLILQPLVENAIYHGMEFMDGDGEIEITVRQVEKVLCIRLRDNGPGMPPDVVQSLLAGNHPVSRRGSGIGVKNVSERIQLYFGKEYGLEILSEPDRGTEIIITMPAVDYDEYTGLGGKLN